VPWPSLPDKLTDLAAQLAGRPDERLPGSAGVAQPTGAALDQSAAVATLLARLMSDLTGLLGAAGYAHVPAPASLGSSS
jgi:hypothetical protein